MLNQTNLKWKGSNIERGHHQAPLPNPPSCLSDTSCPHIFQDSLVCARLRHCCVRGSSNEVGLSKNGVPAKTGSVLPQVHNGYVAATLMKHWMVLFSVQRHGQAQVVDPGVDTVTCSFSVDFNFSSPAEMGPEISSISGSNLGCHSGFKWPNRVPSLFPSCGAAHSARGIYMYTYTI